MSDENDERRSDERSEDADNNRLPGGDGRDTNDNNPSPPNLDDDMHPRGFVPVDNREKPTKGLPIDAPTGLAESTDSNFGLNFSEVEEVEEANEDAEPADAPTGVNSNSSKENTMPNGNDENEAEIIDANEANQRAFGQRPPGDTEPRDTDAGNEQEGDLLDDAIDAAGNDRDDDGEQNAPPPAPEEVPVLDDEDVELLDEGDNAQDEEEDATDTEADQAEADEGTDTEDADDGSRPNTTGNGGGGGAGGNTGGRNRNNRGGGGLRFVFGLVALLAILLIVLFGGLYWLTGDDDTKVAENGTEGQVKDFPGEKSKDGKSEEASKGKSDAETMEFASNDVDAGESTEESEDKPTKTAKKVVKKDESEEKSKDGTSDDKPKGKSDAPPTDDADKAKKGSKLANGHVPCEPIVGEDGWDVMDDHGRWHIKCVVEGEMRKFSAVAHDKGDETHYTNLTPLDTSTD